MEYCKDLLDQSCYTLSHCKLLYNCSKLVPFKTLLFPAVNLKLSTCWLQWLFKKKKTPSIPEPDFIQCWHELHDKAYSNFTVPGSCAAFSLYFSRSHMSFPTPFYIKSGRSSKRCSGFWIIWTKWRLCRKKHVKCIVLTHKWEVLYLKHELWHY